MSARRSNVSRSFFNRMIRNNSRIIENDLLGEESDDSGPIGDDVPIGRNDGIDNNFPDNVIHEDRIDDVPIGRNEEIPNNEIHENQIDVDNDDVPEELFFVASDDEDGDYGERR